MKNALLIFTLLTLFFTGVLFTSCQSSAEKVSDAKTEVQVAEQDLKNAEIKEQQAANEAAWMAFKADIDVKIKANETAITELKAKIKKFGKKSEAMYEKSIAELEQRNTALRTRLDSYTFGKSDWETFKSEFNRDMDGLGQAIKDLVVTNKQ